MSVAHPQRRFTMYRLRDLKNGQYQIHVQNGPAFEGTWLAISTIGEDCGVDPSEMEVAKQALADSGHDFASFGINGTFMYTSLDERKRAA